MIPLRSQALPLIISALAICGSLAGCGGGQPSAPGDITVTNAPEPDFNPVAEAYVKLVLAVGRHDGDYVDAYYGPEHWKAEAEATEQTLDIIRQQAEELVTTLGSEPPDTAEKLADLRWRYLRKQLQSLIARVDYLNGVRSTFDEEALALYDTTPRRHDEDHFQAVLDELEQLLAGEGFNDGSLLERYEAFRQGFVVPPDKLDPVFRAAIEACRERTQAHIELPAGESFGVEYVTDKPWSGYNWYQGNFESLIQVNTDLPFSIERAVHLACHEGYPGHHLYNALLETHLVAGRGWVEYSVYPLFSPQSLIAEGTANFGVELAFPEGERMAFERDVLFPLAGLDTAKAQTHQRALELVAKLSYADNEAARRYLDGEIDAAQAADWLTRYAAMSPERAAQRVQFIDKYRSYIINYTVGQDLVRDYVEARAGDEPAKRWDVFEQLISSPRLPSGLQ